MSSFITAFLPPFKRHLAYARFYKCLSFQWSEKERKFVRITSTPRRAAILTWNILRGSYVAFQIVSLTLHKHSLPHRLVGTLILAMYGSCFALGLETEPDSMPIEMINRLVSGQGWLKFFKKTNVNKLRKSSQMPNQTSAVPSCLS